MRSWQISNKYVEVGVGEVGGILDPVRFHTEAGPVEPLHRAPWVSEAGAADTPVEQHLRGDFFCAPFGASDVLTDESRPHGASANGRWQLIDQREDTLKLELLKNVSGARLLKTVLLRPNDPVVYQQHDLVGGSGALPLGHHTMLHASEPLHLSFSPYLWGSTPPEPVETLESGGRSLLRYPQTFHNLNSVVLADGEQVDLSVFPRLVGSEEIILLVTDLTRSFAWSAACAPQAGWVWFALKNPQSLRATLLWLSNGGRDYPPWSGRHTRCLGVEEVTSYFHLGHHVSANDNDLNRRGIPTTLELAPGSTVSVRYAFGLVTTPEAFGPVATIEQSPQGITLSDARGTEIAVSCDLDFVTS